MVWTAVVGTTVVGTFVVGTFVVGTFAVGTFAVGATVGAIRGASAVVAVDCSDCAAVGSAALSRPPEQPVAAIGVRASSATAQLLRNLAAISAFITKG
jgi:hypothetical protein